MMDVMVEHYIEESNELQCQTEAGELILVDPFVGCAVDAPDENYIEVGNSLVGHTFTMTHYFISKFRACYIPSYFELAKDQH